MVLVECLSLCICSLSSPLRLVLSGHIRQALAFLNCLDRIRFTAETSHSFSKYTTKSTWKGQQSQLLQAMTATHMWLWRRPTEEL